MEKHELGEKALEVASEICAILESIDEANSKLWIYDNGNRSVKWGEDSNGRFVMSAMITGYSFGSRIVDRDEGIDHQLAVFFGQTKPCRIKGFDFDEDYVQEWLDDILSRLKESFVLKAKRVSE